MADRGRRRLDRHGLNDASPPITGPFVPYPAYFGVQLATNLTSSGGSVVTVTSDTDRLSAYGVKLANGHLALLVINKSLTTDFDAALTVDGLVPASPATAWTYGRAEDVAQKANADGAASVTETATSTSPWRRAEPAARSPTHSSPIRWWSSTSRQRDRHVELAHPNREGGREPFPPSLLRRGFVPWLS